MKNISQPKWHQTLYVAVFTVAVIASCTSIPPPTEQIEVSKAAIANATSAGANELASADMSTAQEKLNRAIEAMAMEDYKTAKLLAEQSEVDAQLAASKARSAKARKSAAIAEDDNRALRKEIDRQ